MTLGVNGFSTKFGMEAKVKEASFSDNYESGLYFGDIVIHLLIPRLLAFKYIIDF